MAFTSTTLTGAITKDSLVLPVAATTGSAIRNVIRIDDEWFSQTADAAGLTLPVRGGEQGSARTSHVSGAVVQMGLASDFSGPPVGADIPVPYAPVVLSLTIVASGAVTVPLSNQHVFLKLLGTTTNAYTIVNPTVAQEGQEIMFEAGAAHAYTVQALDSVGAASTVSFSGTTDVATFAGAIGDGFKVKAISGAWQILYLHNVTVA